MVKYAREDTHYLLYIYDCIRNDLIQKGHQTNASNPYALIRSVYSKSNALCMKTYTKPIVKDYGYYMMVARNRTL
jgi:exosome complex exonuclease RRP6